MEKLPLKPLKKKRVSTPIKPKSTQKKTSRQKKKPIEERGFFGKLQAFFSGEMTRKAKQSARSTSSILRSQRKK